MNKILLELAIKDGLTPVLNAQVARAKELQKEYSNAARVARAANFAQTGKWALPKTGALGMPGNPMAMATGAIAAGLSVYGAATSFIGKIVEGARMQNDALRVASDISTRMGVSFRESKAIVEQSQADIQRLASSLPGSTKDYQEVFNGIAVAISKNAQGDKERFRKDALDLTKRFGAMGAIVGADATDTGQAVNRFLSGTATFGEISRVDGIQKNTGFVDTFRSTASEMGLNVERSKTWSFAQRLEVMKKAAEKAMPDSLLDEFSNSVDGLYQTIKDSFVSPISGAFGVLRKVGTRDNRTVMDATKSLLSGTKRMLDSLTAIGKALGFTSDPMAMAIDFIDGITDAVSKMAIRLEAMQSGLSRASTIAGSIRLNKIVMESFGEWVGQAVGWVFTPQGLGTIAKMVANIILGIGNFTNGVLGGLLGRVTRGWGGLAVDIVRDIWEAIKDLGRKIAEGIAALNPLNALTSMVTGAASFLPGSDLIGGAIQGAGGMLENMTGLDLPGIGPEKPKAPVTNNVSFVLPETTSDPQAIAQAVLDRLNSLYSTAVSEGLA